VLGKCHGQIGRTLLMRRVAWTGKNVIADTLANRQREKTDG
jgi:hypothetical protein